MSKKRYTNELKKEAVRYLVIAEQILTTLYEELTEEQREQSTQILEEIHLKHPKMLGGVEAQAVLKCIILKATS